MDPSQIQQPATATWLWQLGGAVIAAVATGATIVFGLYARFLSRSEFRAHEQQDRDWQRAMCDKLDGLRTDLREDVHELRRVLLATRGDDE